MEKDALGRKNTTGGGGKAVDEQVEVSCCRDFLWGLFFGLAGEMSKHKVSLHFPGNISVVVASGFPDTSRVVTGVGVKWLKSQDPVDHI